MTTKEEFKLYTGTHHDHHDSSQPELRVAPTRTCTSTVLLLQHNTSTRSHASASDVIATHSDCTTAPLVMPLS